jgi:DNA invertase Pin-like site-specific DNA recombinase
VSRREVAVYKVDRLTRSVADFAKMVEVFDARGVSFVQFTKHFARHGQDSGRLSRGSAAEIT